MSRSRLLIAAVALVSGLIAGCGGSNPQPTQHAPVIAPPAQPPVQPAPPPTADAVAAERAKLSPADRALADAQEWCAVSTDERLGAMGPPIKLDIKGQTVFVCCKGCQKKAEADPEKTLGILTALKTKASGTSPVAPDKKGETAGGHDHAKSDPKPGGHDHGGMGGMMGDPKMMQDMMGIRALFAAKDKITRKVTVLKNGVETVTESDDDKVAEQIRQHVATMYKRIEDGKPIMPMNHQPIFAEMIKHAKKITLKTEKTDKGIKVTETSDDPYVAKLLQSHAELVDKFIKNGMEQMMKEHPLPEKGDAPAKKEK